MSRKRDTAVLIVAMQFAWAATFLIGGPSTKAWGQPSEANYDESRVPSYQLPDPLVTAAGMRVTTAQQWWQLRRPEVLQLFEREMYGKAPGRPNNLRWQVTEQSEDALAGLARRKQVTIFLSENDDGPRMDVLIYLPRDVEGPVPTFLGLNFNGNHSIVDDPHVHLSTSWMRGGEPDGVVDQKATEAGRGRSASRWPLQQILPRGYAVATIYYGDIDPDFDDGFQNGIHPLFYRDGQTAPESSEWGSIAAWAWGLSRALDYLTDDPDLDHERVIVLGHSRLGKTALWAGANDQRFAVVISNNSGCGGAALSRRQFGETVARINSSFPHWFCDNFNQYNHREEDLPIDQHELIALIAPRPVLVCSAEEDRWADPRGEFLACREADPVYRLLGVPGIDAEEMPPLNQLTGTTIGYHIRPGKHDMTSGDWQVYCDFADRFLKSENR